MKRFAWMVLASGLLCACATPEFRQARGECSPEAFQQHPVHLVATLVTHTSVVQVPTGQTHCVTTQTGNVSNTSCQQVMRMDVVPYQERVMVDVNAARREAVMNQCAAQLCNTRYGNPACKTKEGERR